MITPWCDDEQNNDSDETNYFVTPKKKKRVVGKNISCSQKKNLFTNLSLVDQYPFGVYISIPNTVYTQKLHFFFI